MIFEKLWTGSSPQQTFRTLEANKLVARRRAIEVAITYTEWMKNERNGGVDLGISYTKLARQKAVFHKFKSQTELDLLDVLDDMDTDQKVSLIFNLIDLNKDGHVEVVELAKVLKLIHANSSLEDALEASQLCVTANDASGDGVLDPVEFVDFLDSMAEFLETEIDYVAHFLIVEIVSLYEGKFVIKETTASDLFVKYTGDFQNVDTFAMVRLIILFQLLDYGEAGSVDFNDIALSMKTVYNHMENDYKSLLFPSRSERKKSRSLDFKEFVDFYLKVVAASPANIEVDDVANEMTRILCEDFKDPLHKKVRHAFRENSLRNLMIAREEHFIREEEDETDVGEEKDDSFSVENKAPEVPATASDRRMSLTVVLDTLRNTK